VRQISASKDFKIPGGDTFIRVFVIRHELAIENSVYFYVVISLHYTLHAFEHNFDRVFEESARLDIFRVYYNTRQNGFQMPFRFRANGPYLVPICTNLPRTDSFKLSSHAIHAINDCLLLIDNCRRLIRLCSSGDSINSSQHCSLALYSSIVLSRVAQLNHTLYCHLRCRID